jgi:glutathione S-transferase
MKFYYSPLSTYSQKTLMALYEKGAPFEPIVVNLRDPAARAEYEKLNPLGKLPLLQVLGASEKDERRVPESSIIIEYIDRHCPGGTKLIPDDADLARQTRFYDRLFDQYVLEHAHKILFDGWRPEDKRDPYGVEQAHTRLEKFLAIADTNMAKKTFALGDAFTMADCTAAAGLTLARRVHPIDAHKALVAYLGRLSERPSYQRVKQESDAYAASFRR